VNPTKFLIELKRRNVYRAAVAYGVVAWFLTQLTTQVFPFFEIPNSAVRFVVIALAVGFPIAMLLAWVYEFTPEGVVRTEDLRPAQARSAQHVTGRILDFIIIGALLLVIAMLIVGRLPFYRQTGESISQKSIAVLPFENLSGDPNNAYFADGIQEEILTRLAKIADLKVISRTSTQRYQSKPGNLAEIAKQLRVANILEGSVQKAGDTVRVSVNLIQAASDSHLWADTYDRNFTDILGVESEIAKTIAEQLQVKLTGREEQALAAKPTNNPEAYDAYLRGLAFEARSLSFFADVVALMPKAIDSFKRAVQLDPNFATAWARLSRTEGNLYFNRFDAATAARSDAAKRALENAQKLKPNSPETLLALGYYQYHVLRDYRAAKTTFEGVTKMLPGSSEVPYALALVTRREGHWDQSIAYFEQALALDPRNVQLLTFAAATHAMVRRFPAALKLYDRVLDITPNDPEIMAAKASIYQAQGNLEEAGKLLSGINEQTPNAIFAIEIQLQFERNYGEVVRLLQGRLAQFHYNSDYENAEDEVRLALAQRLAGDTAGAKVTAEEARNTLEPLQESTRQRAVCGSAVQRLCRNRGEGPSHKGSRASSHASAAGSRRDWRT
jgi:TolB-like protein/Flp pilus assembly protein TadD